MTEEEEVKKMANDGFPRTMQSGAFAGRTFDTRREYWAALRDTKGSRKIVRKPRKSKSKDEAPTTSNGPSVRAILRAYETLRAEGLGEAKSARIVEELILGR